jgi:hypothetical protein
MITESQVKLISDFSKINNLRFKLNFEFGKWGVLICGEVVFKCDNAEECYNYILRYISDYRDEKINDILD